MIKGTNLFVVWKLCFSHRFPLGLILNDRYAFQFVLIAFVIEEYAISYKRQAHHFQEEGVGGDDENEFAQLTASTGTVRETLAEVMKKNSLN